MTCKITEADHKRRYLLTMVQNMENLARAMELCAEGKNAEAGHVIENTYKSIEILEELKERYGWEFGEVDLDI